MKTKIINHPSILQWTAIKVLEDHQPHRLVLRFEPTQVQPYVIHHENLSPVVDGDVMEWHHHDFYWGTYFYRIEDAQKEFESRRW